MLLLNNVKLPFNKTFNFNYGIPRLRACSQYVHWGTFLVGVELGLSQFWEPFCGWRGSAGFFCPWLAAGTGAVCSAGMSDGTPRSKKLKSVDCLLWLDGELLPLCAGPLRSRGSWARRLTLDFTTRSTSLLSCIQVENMSKWVSADGGLEADPELTGQKDVQNTLPGLQHTLLARY